MTFGQAFTTIFDDSAWVNKAIVLIVLTFAAILLTPFVIGLAAWGILFGYQLDLIRNIRDERRPPLPAWSDMGRLLTNGASVLLAYVIYLLPNLFMAAFTFFITAAAGNTTLVSGGVSLGLACCLFPILLIYNLIALPMFTIGQIRHLDDPRLSTFFRFGSLYDAVRSNFGDVVQWWGGTLIALVVIGFLSAIPCLGWIAAAALMIPVFGAVTGILAHTLHNKRKLSKRKESPQRR